MESSQRINNWNYSVSGFSLTGGLHQSDTR